MFEAPIHVPESPSGYESLGQIFLAYAPPGHAFNEELVRAIRNDIDPEICPMWCWHVYRGADNSIVKIGRYWLWKEVQDYLLPQHHEKQRFIPDSYGLNAGRHPNFRFLPLELDRTEEEIENGWAGGFVEMDWWIYDMLRDGKAAWHPDYNVEADRREAAEAQQKEEAQAEIEAEYGARVDEDYEHMAAVSAKLTAKEKRLIRQYGLFQAAELQEAERRQTSKPAMVEVHKGAQS